MTSSNKSETHFGNDNMRLRAVLNTAVDGVVIIDRFGIVQMCNPACERLFGYAVEEILGQNVKMLMPAPYREEHDGYIAQYRETGERKIIGIGREVSGRRKDGSVFPMDLSVGESGAGDDRVFIGIIRDLTERKSVEARTSHLGRIVEDSLNEIYVFDSETLAFTQVNRGARENLGYSADELKCLTPVDIKPRFSKEAFLTLLGPLRRGEEQKLVFETLHERKDGTTYDVKVHLQYMAAEQPSLFVAIIEDISEQKIRDEQLRQAQKMEAVGQLTGGIAHDFNNLLTVITGNLEMLQARIDGESQRVMVDQALEAAELGATLTGRLLAFARRQTLEPSPIDLNEEVLGLTDLMQRTLGETVHVSTVMASGLGQAMADPGQVQNCILNLALNARDAMADGGDLLIETRNAEFAADDIPPGLELAAGRYVQLSVTDSGSGMTPEAQERAFEPFFTTKGTGSGTGLGLSMVYGFVKQSGGHVTIYSELGHGTTVNLYLPLVESQDETHSDRGSAKDSFPGGGETLLVVEDDPRVRQVTLLRLGDLGYRVLEAESGQAALDLLDSGAGVDLLFTDVVMPGGMNGGELAERARRLRPGLKTLFTSGYAEPVVTSGGVLAEGAALLRKPYNQRELAQAIRKALEA